jgi:2-aminoadipate transaminase
MRLTSSGSEEAEIEEGVRRIGKVIAQQVELYSTLTGHPIQTPPEPDEGGDVVPFRREESA